MITDDPIRDLECQLIDAAARANAEETVPTKRPQSGRTIRRRNLVAGLSVAAAICIAVAGFPLGLFGGDETRGKAPILGTAAALAADQPATTARYRYTKLIDRRTYTIARGEHRASVTLEQASEQWVNKEGRGRQVLQPSRVVARSGDPALAAALPSGLRAPGAQPYPPSGAVRSPIPLDELRGGGEAVLQTLRSGYRAGRISPDGSRPSIQREPYQVTTLILSLLGDANVTPHQRGALFEALAGLASAKSLGTVTDQRGRTGQGVVITTHPSDPLPRARFEVIYDPTTSALLSWKVENHVAAVKEGALAEYSHILIRAGSVDTSSTRP